MFLQKFIMLQMCRHATVSLEMLLKLVAVFGPVIRSTISARPAVGVNLQAEQRYRLFRNLPHTLFLQVMNECFTGNQIVNKIRYENLSTGCNAATNALSSCKRSRKFFRSL